MSTQHAFPPWMDLDSQMQAWFQETVEQMAAEAVAQLPAGLSFEEAERRVNKEVTPEKVWYRTVKGTVSQYLEDEVAAGRLEHAGTDAGGE